MLPRALRILAVVMTLWLLLPPPARPEPAHPLAEVDGAVITDEEVEKSLGPALQRLQEQMYSMKRQRLDALIAQRLLLKEAARRGVTIPALLDAEVTSKVALVTEEEVEAFVRSDPEAVGGDTEGAGRERARAYLQRERLQERRDAFIQSLRERVKIVVHLQPPPVTRVTVPTEGAAVRGAPDARVQLVEFTDYHCPYCRRAHRTVLEVTTRFAGRLQYVHKDFPIDALHPAASKAHEAARCAADQGKFWEYRERLYASPPSADPAVLAANARAVGADVPAFEGCLRSGKHRGTVQHDIDEGTRLGVTATPTFYIAGRALIGAQPLSRFVEMIEDELAR